MGVLAHRGRWVAALLLVPALSACGALHGGGTAADRKPLPAATGTPTPGPTVSSSPGPSPSVPAGLVPKPSPATVLTLHGAISGPLSDPTVICEQNIPVGGQGYMAVSGTAGGRSVIVTIWSASRYAVQELYIASQPGDIEYGLGGARDVTNFDWMRGATIPGVQLPAMSPNTGPPVTVSGTIVCP